MKLEIISGSNRRSHSTRSGLRFIRIGSTPDNDIALPGEPAASAMHARIECFMGRWTVTDQMSDNGTRVNGESVYSADLKAGDVISIGATQLRVISLDDSSGDSAPARPAAQRQSASNASPAPASRASAPASRGSFQPAPLPRPFVPPVTVPDAQPARKKSNPAAVVVFFLFFGGILALVIAGIVMDELNQEPAPEDFFDVPEVAANQEAAKPQTPKQQGGGTAVAPQSRRLSSKEEQALRTRLQALTEKSNTESWETRLEQLDALIEEFKDREHSLGYLFQRARLSLANSLDIELSKRSATDQREIYDLKSADNYREAIARIEALKAHVEGNTYRKSLADRAGLVDYLERTPGELAAANEMFIGRQFLAADGALALDDLKTAAAALGKLAELAHLEDSVRELISLEHQGVLALQEKQAAGEWPPAREPFNKRKWKPPAAPKNSLLPDGDASQYRFISPLRDKLVKAAKAGQMNRVLTLVHGCDAVLEGGDGWRLNLKVTRALKRADHSLLLFTYSINDQVSNLPTATVVRLYEQLPNAGRAELLGALCFCFENGLMQDAPRVALKLWKADDSVKADLDSLLAAKMGIAVPEGGFVEQDGRLVPP